MSIQQAMEIYGDLLVIVAAIIATGSVILHARVDWRHSPMGRHIMAYLLSLAILFDLTFIDNILLNRPDPLWFEILQLVMYTALPITMAWRLVIQWNVRPKKGKRRITSNNVRSDDEQ